MVNVNLLYPVGSIYISVNSKNPSEIFGGTWERIKGKMLLGVDEDDQDFSTSGKTGGEKEHKLTIDETPPHNHTTNGNKIAAAKYAYESTNKGTFVTNNTGGYLIGDMDYVGGGQPHNNMPPYFTCYIWYRTA